MSPPYELVVFTLNEGVSREQFLGTSARTVWARVVHAFAFDGESGTISNGRVLIRGRAAVEREFDGLKNEYGLDPLRVRGLDKARLHADLVMLARLSQALARARAVPARGLARQTSSS